MSLQVVSMLSPAMPRPPRKAAARSVAADGNAKRPLKGGVVQKPVAPSIGVDLKAKPAARAPAPAQVALVTAPPPPPSAATDGNGKLTPQPIDPAHIPIGRGDFPPGFVFGGASSSYQVEGAWDKDGKGLSVWDVFTRERPEMIIDRSNGDVAIDFYHKFESDLDYAKEANMDAYRFSICWPRILPKGSLSGGINKAGIAHYSRMIDAIVAKGLKPFVTLFHWETPHEIESQYHSFLSQRFVDDYCDFVDICFNEFGNRVKHWITFNEPSLVCQFGYSMGILPPARCSPWATGNCAAGDSTTEPYIAGHHLLLAHAAAVRIYRSKYQATQQGKIGMTVTSSWCMPYDKTSKADMDAASRVLDFGLGWFLDPITQGDYPYTMKATLGTRLPRFTTQQSNLLKGSFDFVGFNYYTSTFVQNQPFIAALPPQSYESDLHALTTGTNKEGVTLGDPVGNHPEGLKSILLYIKDHYNNPPIYITENGLRMQTQPKEEAIDDTKRISYHLQHLTNLSEAIKEGAKVEGYFAWSLHDSFEWNSGFTLRFGLIYCDFDDLERTPKKSYRWFQAFLQKDQKQDDRELIPSSAKSGQA